MANVNWKKLNLSDELILKLADLYLSEEEWFQVFSIAWKKDLEMICHFLMNQNRISVEQFGIWAARKEWTHK